MRKKERKGRKREEGKMEQGIRISDDGKQTLMLAINKVRQPWSTAQTRRLTCHHTH